MAAIAPRAGAVLAAVACAWSIASAALAGGDPSPAGPRLDVWLDAALPTTAAPGSTVRLGYMTWDPVGRRLARDMSPFVRLVPAGGGIGERATSVQDFGGHYVASVPVPDGGIGGVEIGLVGHACDADGCRESDWLFDIAGVGPPPDAPLPAVATAQIELPASATVAGRPAGIGIRLTPRVPWDASGFAYPEALLVQVSIPRGSTIVEATATAIEGQPGDYAAHVAIPEPGEYRVIAAASQEGADPVPFSASLATITVDPADGEAPPGPAVDTGTGPDLVLPALAAGIALAVGAALLAIRRRRSA